MQTTVWGPVGWKFLHSVAHGYPESPSDFDRERGVPIGTTAASYERFFVLLGSVLPCKHCRDSYLQYVSESPVRAASRSSLTEWLWGIHNKVNKKLKANYTNADLDTVRAEYESFRARCNLDPSLGCNMPDINTTKKTSRVIIDKACVRVNPRHVLLTVLLAFATLSLYLKLKQRSPRV